MHADGQAAKAFVMTANQKLLVRIPPYVGDIASLLGVDSALP